MPVSPNELPNFNGKTVEIVIDRDGTQEQLVGKVELANEVGVAFKPKGKRDVDFIEPPHIVSISEIAEPSGDLRQKKLPPLDASKARTHLVDRHGAPLK